MTIIDVDWNNHIPQNYFDNIENILCFDNYPGTWKSVFNSSTTIKLPFIISDIYNQFEDIRRIAYIMAEMLQTIPIYLRGGKTAPVLGLYHHISTNNPYPYIELFMDKIFDNNRYNDKIILATVLIHELAHAALSPENYGLADQFSDTYRKYLATFAKETRYYSCATTILYPNKKNSEEKNYISSIEPFDIPLSFYHIREESFANLIAWKILNLSYEKKIISIHDLHYVETCMGSQPSYYRFALHLKESKKIGEWVRSKVEQGMYIDNTKAQKWISLAEYYYYGNLSFSDFLYSEKRLQVPWKNDGSISQKSIISGKYGITDKFGEYIIDDIYDQIIDLGLGLYHYIFNGGLFICRSIRTPRGSWTLGGYLVKKNNSLFMTDEKGCLIGYVKYDEVEAHDHEYKVRIGNQWGWVDKRGKLLVEVGYDEVEPLNHGYKVRIGNQWGWIDGKGETIVGIKYDEIESQNKGFKVREGNHWGWIGGWGGIEYDEVEPLTSWYKVRIGNHWGCVNEYGKVIVAIEYDEVVPIHYRLGFKVRIGNHWGWINERGELKVAVEYEDVKIYMSGAVIEVKINNKWTLFKNIKSYPRR